MPDRTRLSIIDVPIQVDEHPVHIPGNGYYLELGAMAAISTNEKRAMPLIKELRTLNLSLLGVLALSVALDATLPLALASIHPCAAYVESDGAVAALLGLLFILGANVLFGVAALSLRLLRLHLRPSSWLLVTCIAALAMALFLARVYAAPYIEHLGSNPEVLCD